jgi:hypothetical protein
VRNSLESRGSVSNLSSRFIQGVEPGPEHRDTAASLCPITSMEKSPTQLSTRMRPLHKEQSRPLFSPVTNLSCLLLSYDPNDATPTRATEPPRIVIWSNPFPSLDLFPDSQALQPRYTHPCPASGIPASWCRPSVPWVCLLSVSDYHCYPAEFATGDKRKDSANKSLNA